MPEWTGRTEKLWRERTRSTTRHTLPKETAAKMPMMHLYNVCSLLVTATSVSHSFCPVVGTACPGQGLQALERMAGAYELMGQRHCCDAAARQYIPTEQMLHASADVLADKGLYVPAGHATHAVLLKKGLYVPAGQGVHSG